tara:strand:- start:229 stop:867 length:639 start_codon:yes stop_codon:yes gene_type:complete
MSSEFGYIPESPEQSFGNNKGIFTPTDIYDLTRADKFTQYGQLELLQTQTASGSSTIDFTSIQESKYNVHFATYNNIQFTLDAFLAGQFSNDGGSSFVTSASYEYARQYGVTDGSFGTSNSTTATGIDFSGNGGATNETHNGYVYFYNLGDSTKYSFVTHHSSQMNSLTQFLFYFGGGSYKVAETINAIRFKVNTGAMDNGSISLYGIKDYS